jgi:hypothetical protein
MTYRAKGIATAAGAQSAKLPRVAAHALGGFMPGNHAARKSASERGDEKVSGHHHDEHQEQASRQHTLMPVLRRSVSMLRGMPDIVIWWRGLAALAVSGVVDWPVVALVVAGTWVADQQADQAGRRQGAAV